MRNPHKLPIKARCLVLVVAATSCAHQPERHESFDEQIRRSRRPVPMDLRAEVERAEQIGASLYAYDSVAWVCTDALFEVRRREDLDLGGYIVLPEGDSTGTDAGWQTIFYSSGESPKVLFRVRIPKGAMKATVEALEPPEEPVPGMDVLIRARATAMHSLERIEQPINPVIMPGAALGESGILVYLIAGTTVPRQVVFGRHHRILISDDGSHVVRSEPLSKAALVMPLEPPATSDGFETEALLVTHLVSSTPVETHVLASLRHDVRVLVATDRGDWLVDGRHITFLGPRED